MKQIITASLLVACAFPGFAEDQDTVEIRQIKEARQRRIHEIDDLYIATLKRQKELYLMKRDFRSAERVDTILVEAIDAKTETEDLGKKARVECDAKYIRFRKGVSAYTDHPNQFHHVPKRFDGKRIMLLPNGGNKSLDFAVKKAGVVTIVTEAGLRSQLDADGWKEVDHALFVPDKPRELPIFQKYLEEGNYSIPGRGHFGTRLLEM